MFVGKTSVSFPTVKEVFQKKKKLKMIKISFFILILSYFLYFYLFPLEKLQPEEFFLKDSLPSLSNNWKKNKELTKDIFHLNKHILLAPESIIIDSYSGVGYTSLSNGRVVAVNQEGNYLYDIFFVGGMKYFTSSSLSLLLSLLFS